MSRFLKTPRDKLETKVNNLLKFQEIKRVRNAIKIRNKTLFKYTTEAIEYTSNRYYATRKKDLIEDDFTVTIPLSHDNLNILSSNPINPPNGAKKVVDLIRNLGSIDCNSIVLGSVHNKIENNKVYITKDLYDIIIKIDREESKDKKVRVSNRAIPFLKKEFGLNVSEEEYERDYQMLLKEAIESGELKQDDLLSLSKSLESGEINKVVIEKQVNKQVKWLIDTIEEILEIENLTKPKAQDFGNKHFGFPKISIVGPEHLMEKILSEYGQYTLFGVPALLNTDKYVSKKGLSRLQFDIILINHLGDIEVVELKRPDQYILEYDDNRAKFYPSKDISIAISQSERYISAVYKDNDEEYLIGGKKIRDFINEQIGGIMFVEAVRPSALIIIGSWTKLCKPYSKQSESVKKKVKKTEYDDNAERAYKELKSAFRNIKILNYSELLEHARTRLQLTEEIVD